MTVHGRRRAGRQIKLVTKDLTKVVRMDCELDYQTSACICIPLAQSKCGAVTVKFGDCLACPSVLLVSDHDLVWVHSSG